MSDSLRPHGLYSPWNAPGQNTGVGSLSLLQGIFSTQGSNPVSRIAGGFLSSIADSYSSWFIRTAVLAVTDKVACLPLKWADSQPDTGKHSRILLMGLSPTPNPSCSVAPWMLLLSLVTTLLHENPTTTSQGFRPFSLLWLQRRRDWIVKEPIWTCFSGPGTMYFNYFATSESLKHKLTVIYIFPMLFRFCSAHLFFWSALNSNFGYGGNVENSPQRIFYTTNFSWHLSSKNFLWEKIGITTLSSQRKVSGWNTKTCLLMIMFGAALLHFTLLGRTEIFSIGGRKREQRTSSSVMGTELIGWFDHFLFWNSSLKFFWTHSWPHW